MYDTEAEWLGMPRNFASELYCVRSEPCNESTEHVQPVLAFNPSFKTIQPQQTGSKIRKHEDERSGANKLTKCTKSENKYLGSRHSSNYKGVSWYQGHQKWRVQIKIDGKIKNLGYFDSEEAAACKYDKAATPLGRALNVPVHQNETGSTFKTSQPQQHSDSRNENSSMDGKSKIQNYLGSDEAGMRKDDEAASSLGKSLKFKMAVKRGTSKYKGVSWVQRGQKWRAEIRIDGKSTHLGYFDSEEAAARKYDESVHHSTDH